MYNVHIKPLTYIVVRGDCDRKMIKSLLVPCVRKELAKAVSLNHTEAPALGRMAKRVHHRQKRDGTALLEQGQAWLLEQFDSSFAG